MAVTEITWPTVLLALAVSATMVDVSPFSTNGALVLANANANANADASTATGSSGSSWRTGASWWFVVPGWS